jgi:trans-aconitate methyltransferase
MILKKLLRRLGHHDSIYDDEYYDRDVEGPASHAAPIIAESIIERFSPRTLIDVGCGTGAMMAAFKERGVVVEGLDYSAAAVKRCSARGLTVTRFDIENAVGSPNKTFDIAISMEVAEHLPESKAEKFVHLLSRLAPTILCTAAGPGQGGTDHVNLKPKQYWIDLFRKEGANFDDRSTTILAARWAQNNVADFYHSNLMIFSASRSELA